MNGWVHFHDESTDVVLRVSGPGRERVSSLVLHFLEKRWSGLEDEDRGDVELLAGLFVSKLPEGLFARRVKRARSSVGSELVTVAVHGRSVDVRVDQGSRRGQAHALFRS